MAVFFIVRLLIGLSLFFLPCCAVGDDYRCSPLSCGDFHNIKCPFTLKGNPHNCSSPWSELACENNRTILHLSPSKKFHVIDISYKGHNIQLVDPGLQKDNCSSMPRYSLASKYYRYNEFNLPPSSRLIFYMNCSTLIDSSYYVDTSPCMNVSSNTYYSYVVLEPAMASDLKNSCTVILMSSMTSGKVRYSSYSDIHSEMLKGFKLNWWFDPKTDCKDKRGFLPWLGGISMVAGTRTVCSKGYMLFYIITLGVGPLFVGRCLLGTPCVAALLIYTLRRRHRAMDAGIEEFLYSYKTLMPTRYFYMDIKRMTKNFSEKLGQGGYGSVFKGVLPNNRPIAIKVMGTSKGNGQEFINEVASIGRIHHVNVVQLIGFVADRSNRALIYDFMPNGSLEKYIFPQGGSVICPLSWEKMYEIAVGVARGIEYLHIGCDIQILHFDIKPHNILLDENFSPKISDFGLARLYPIDDSIVSITAVRGTIGYIAPELFYRNIGGVSYKSDVYSFGMLLLEMAGRRKNLNALAEDSSQMYFPSWIYEQLDRGEDIEMEDATEEKEMAKKMIIVGLWCIQMKPIDRPSMTKVVEMLEGSLGPLKMPPKPFVLPDHEEMKTLYSIEISSSTG